MSEQVEEQEAVDDGPNPADIALVALQGLLASGKYDNMQSACATAWQCVLPFYQGAQQFAHIYARMMEHEQQQGQTG